MQEEIWKDVPNYKGLYQVSSLGRVRSLKRKVIHYTGCYSVINGKILTQIGKTTRYLGVSLSLNGYRKTFRVHQLMAITFLNHEPNGHKLVVDHIDNNPLNNKLSNLQIVTHKHNLRKNSKNYKYKYDENGRIKN